MDAYYKIETNKGIKQIDMIVRGRFSVEDNRAFIAEYNKACQAVPTGEYDLSIDCTDMELVKPEMVSVLKNTFVLYKESGFKRIILVVKGKMVLKLQLKRLAKEAGLTNAVVQRIN